MKPKPIKPVKAWALYLDGAFYEATRYQHHADGMMRLAKHFNPDREVSVGPVLITPIKKAKKK